MKDARHVFLFIGIGLAAAFFASTPLRREGMDRPIGTPLTGAATYAAGTVVVDPALADAAAQKAAIFLIVRPVAGGPPVAVQKREFPSFPLRFRVTTGDNMIGSEFFEGPIEVVARLDRDGVAGPVTADDIEAIVPVDPKRRENLTIQIAPAQA